MHADAHVCTYAYAHTRAHAHAYTYALQFSTRRHATLHMHMALGLLLVCWFQWLLHKPERHGGMAQPKEPWHRQSGESAKGGCGGGHRSASFVASDGEEGLAALDRCCKLQVLIII